MRAAVLGPVMAGIGAAGICDQLLAPAFHRIGDDWAHDSLEV